MVTKTQKFLGRSALSTGVIGLALVAAPAFAQDDTASTAEDTGTIVVTGTLIKNPNLTSSAPVAFVGQEEVRLRQSNVAEEILRDMPGDVANIGSAVNNGNNGASYVDLRGLGSNRNIVLLDGNRIAPSNTVGRVDLNNIPLALIERTDMLTGGASTTYGADAISGVVNFVTRKDFSGIEATAGTRMTEDGDGNYFHADITVGANLDDGRGNVVFSIGYQQSDPVYQGDRKFSNTQYGSSDGKAGGSDVSVPGEFVLGNSLMQIDPTTGTLVPVYAKYNFNPYNVFQTPFERFNMYGAANYEVADGIELYTRGMFSKNTVKTIIASSGVFDEVLSVPISNPYLPAGVRNQYCTAAGISAADCTAAVSATDPNDPAFRTLDIETLRRMPELGPRISDYQTTMFDYRAGVRGNITNSITFDVSGSYGESTNLQTIQNYALLSRVKQALAATNTTTCLDDSNGCVPLNIFGANGSITPQQAAFLTANSTTNNKTSLAQARALINGDFGLALPWADDAISFAVGAEYRKYKASQESDLLAQTAGELGGAGGAAPNIDGGYDVYGELIAPLVQGKPFFEELTFETGVRYSSYNVFAPGNPSYNTTTYKFGGTWGPGAGLKIRGNYQHAVRAPNIAELFTPVTTGLTNLDNEPCMGTAPLSNPNLAAVCLAQGAPASSIGSIQAPNSGQANQTGGGNPNLKPETSNSYTVGVLFQPEFVPGLSVSIDYYNIKVKGAITTPTPDDVLGACFDNLTAASATDPVCTAIRRNPGTGQLSGSPAVVAGLPTPLSNLGRLATDGIDLAVNYRRDLGFAKLNLSLNGNWTAHSKFQATESSENRDCVGYYSVNCLSIQPEFYWNQRTTLSFENVDVSLLWRHIDGVKFEPGLGTRYSGPLIGGPLDGKEVNFNRIPSYDYFDLSSRVELNDNFELTFTISNLFDKQPPIVGNTIGSTTYNSGNTYPATYDALGRTYSISGRFRF
ncbi:TonB-dependent receptor domain-containing protein [Sphingomonas fennica]|uniref:TonB-dependent receptor n=1 Tax=Edaphosphingomonas fennica TaxID=114404 RepID=A0A2T4HJT2_9SPHN|nr:TonB-dependent receptor [Sphingomonas fennica]PTD16062.1 TonB-dependent receptor [Sphingomonas fennica]